MAVALSFRPRRTRAAFAFRMKGTPRSYQAPASAHIFVTPTAAIFAIPGSGKTRIVLEAATDLANAAEAEGRRWKCVVLAPLTVASAVWEEEAKKWTTLPCQTALAREKEKKAEALQNFFHLDSSGILVTNYETCRTLRTEMSVYLGRVDMVVADESRRLANGRAQLTKGAMFFSRAVPRRVILTGTPIARSPMDIFTQMLWLDKGKTFGTHFVPWRLKYFYPHPSGFGWQPMPGAVRRLAQAVSPLAYEITGDTLTLPEKNEISVNLPMSLEQERINRELIYDLKAEIHGQTYSTFWATAAWSKAMQVASGYVLLDGKPVEVESPKWDWLREFLLDTLPPREPVLFFATHRATLTKARDVAQKAGRRTGLVTGSSHPETRKKLAQDFKRGDLDALFFQAETGKFGLSFENARYVVFLEPPKSAETRLQGLSRIIRPAASAGAMRPVFIYELAVGPLEKKSYEALRRSADVLREFFRFIKGGRT